MTHSQALECVKTAVSTLLRPDFYGSVTFQIQGGEITIIRLEQTLKPNVVKKHWKEMTVEEYIVEKGGLR